MRALQTALSLSSLPFAAMICGVLLLSCQDEKPADQASPPAKAKAAERRAGAIQRLAPSGNDFVDEDGKPVRLWGVNLASFYPERPAAERTAESLASLGVNCVRPHHLLRPSKDWCQPACHSLAKYESDSRTANPEAWDRFDYLNAKLREKGIYLMLAAEWSRSYLPGDVSMLDGGPEDNAAWQAAVKELNSWDWRRSIDVKKMLPLVDERAALLNEEFARRLLKHVNPYAKTTYGDDPQVVTLELVNESSMEYAVICGNKFPEYFAKRLDAKWRDFLKSSGAEPCDIYKPDGERGKKLRADFFRRCEEDYFKRMERLARDCGFKGAIAYSNLWRGESALKMHSDLAGYIENHAYTDPMGVCQTWRTALEGKPYIIGELNHSEHSKDLERQKRERTALALAMAAYGSFDDLAGVIWFAWCHGDKEVGSDGWAKSEGRTSNLGNIVADGMLLDHFRTCSTIFRNGLVRKSSQPQTVFIDEPFQAFDYHALMNGKVQLKNPGWQAIHSFRKSFGKAPESQASAEWLTKSPGNPLVSDTGEIVRDLEKRQLTVSAPSVEAFSGYLSRKEALPLKKVACDSIDWFATLILVATDGKPLESSRKLLLSRTVLDANGKDVNEAEITLKGLNAEAGGSWRFKATRPRGGSQEWIELSGSGDGSFKLPQSAWTECELEFKQ